MKTKIGLILSFLLCAAAILAYGGFGDVESPCILSAFNSGEMSPLMYGRVDFPKYSQGLKTCENCLPLTQGPVTRRPGTKFIAPATPANTTVRLIPFEYSTTDAYILEFGNLTMRVYRNGGQVLDANSDPYEIDTRFDDDELASIQYAQSGNTMYLVDANDPPQALTRTGHAAWTIQDVNFTTGPFLPRDTTGTTLASSAVSGTTTLTASDAVFAPGHVGSLWKLYNHRADSSVHKHLDANGVTSSLAISGAYSAVSHGTWRGVLTLERSYDAGATWDGVLAIASWNDNNLNTSGTEDEANALYRLEMSDYTSGTVGCTISALSYLDYGVVKVTGFVDPCEVNGVIIDDLVVTRNVAAFHGAFGQWHLAYVVSGATAIWQEGYWSDTRGWPRAIAFHEQRLWFGGSTSYPQTLWSSQTAENEGDYENMTAGTLADSALIFTLPGKNPIQWLFSQSYLMIGSAGGVGRLGSDTAAMTPDNVDYKTQTKSAAAAIQPVAIGDTILYAERGGRKMRQYLYSMDVDQFIAPDITILSEHITGDGLTGMAIQMNPEPILWCPRTDGQIATVTYLKEQQVAAWGRQTTPGADGIVKSIAVIPGALEDEVWMAVARTIDGNSVLYIEQVQPQKWGTDQNDCWFVDSGLSFDGGAAVNVTAATKANPCRITVSIWPTDGNDANLADGDQVRFKAVGGMTQLNGNVYTVDDANITAKTFTLDDSAGTGNINSTAFTMYSSGGTVQRVENTFGGLDHLEGQTVAVWGDGQTQETAVVDANTVTLDVWLNRATIGLAYTSTIQTMPLIPAQGPGAPVGSRKKVITVALDFYKTTGAQVGGDSSHLVTPAWGTAGSDAAPALVSDWRDVLDLNSGWQRDPTITIRQTNPAPMTIRQLVAEVRSNR